MLRARSRISEAELNAYIDDQLDAAGRIEVEDYLAANPDVAARVMADLSMRDALRLTAAKPREEHRRETIVLAERLSRSLSWRRMTSAVTRIAAAVGIFALGWGSSLGWEQIQQARNVQPEPSTLPAFVLDALNSHSASLTRAIADDGDARLDAERLAHELAVTIPRLPEGWRILDAHFAESSTGTPGIEIVLDAPEIGQLSLVARHSPDVRIILPTFASNEGRNIAYWQLVSNKYALTGDLPNEPLQTAALRLFQTLY
jgi:anti-sigma factor RsiW